MYIFKNHFEGKDTYVIGGTFTNGCQKQITPQEAQHCFTVFKVPKKQRQRLRHEFLDGWSADVVGVLAMVAHADSAALAAEEDNTMPVDVVAEEPEEEPWCVMCGNPVGGFDVFGPFSSNGLAVEWADGLIDKDWWIMRLQKPGPA